MSNDQRPTCLWSFTVMNATGSSDPFYKVLSANNFRLRPCGQKRGFRKNGYNCPALWPEKILLVMGNWRQVALVHHNAHNHNHTTNCPNAISDTEAERLEFSNGGVYDCGEELLRETQAQNKSKLHAALRHKLALRAEAQGQLHVANQPGS